jgi:hypothetical protein
MWRRFRWNNGNKVKRGGDAHGGKKGRIVRPFFLATTYQIFTLSSGAR